jgi:hypothetical protein
MAIITHIGIRLKLGEQAIYSVRRKYHVFTVKGEFHMVEIGRTLERFLLLNCASSLNGSTTVIQKHLKCRSGFILGLVL